jgi:anti-sigma B factor antagonist
MISKDFLRLTKGASGARHGRPDANRFSGESDMYTSGPVIVMELPQQLNRAQVKTFFAELQPLLETDRPRLVLDCSQVRLIDSAGVAMLLQCMQEAMKRDGDLKLASVSAASAAILELMRVDRLFEIFSTAKEAVQSFDAVPSYPIPQSVPLHAAAYGALEDLKVAG